MYRRRMRNGAQPGKHRWLLPGSFGGQYASPLMLNLAYPRSFRRLLALGFALVVLPLAFALVGNAITIRDMTARGKEAVYSASRMTEATWLLLENLRRQERAVLQYRVLRDPAYLNACSTLHLRFGEAMHQLSALSLATERRAELDSLATREQALHQALEQAGSAKTPGTQLDDVAARYLALVRDAEDFLRHNGKVIDAEVRGLQDLALRAERTMLIQIAALLPAVLLLVLGFTRLLAGPVGQLEAAIGGLWSGRFDRRIEVGGPSDLQNLGTQLDRLRLRLMQLEERKSRFLRHVSHEIKTPLAALTEGSALLAEEAAGPLAAQQKEIVGILTDNARRLHKLIEDLLAYSAADFEQSVLQRQVFPLRALVDSVVDSQRLVLNARGIRIQVDMDDIALDADRERMRIVLDNLLSNAAKYSPAGGTITVLGRREGAEVVIEVSDQGPGIAEEDREHVFDPFFQGRIPGAGPVKGSGLGLSIAQEHVLAHGGRLLILPGPGARFQVRLPNP